MSMIFPGMDPYLEATELWPGVHASLVVHLRDHLQPLLRPRYIAAIEERVFVQGPDAREIVPDGYVRKHRPERDDATVAVLEADTCVRVFVPEREVHETYLEILDLQAGQRVVTVLEVVSPTNKYTGPGRDSYLAKQREVRGSQAHLVEIDLLRSGPHVLAVPEWAARNQGPYYYLICVNRAEGRRENFELYPRSLRERLPKIRLPLAEGSPDVVPDLQGVLERTYEAGSYRDRLRYDRPCVPRLSPGDQAWADERIRAAGLTPQAVDQDT